MTLLRRSALLLITLCFTTLVSLGQTALEEADALYRASKWTEAAEVLKAVIPELEGEEKVTAMRRLAYCYERHGKQFDKALAVYREALQVPGGKPASYSAAQLRIGYCVKAQQKLEASIPELMKVLEIEGAAPDHKAEALLYAGWSYNGLDQHDKAIETMKRCAAVEGAHGNLAASAWFTIGRIHELKKQHPEALEAYQNVLDNPGTNHHQRENALSQMGEIRMLMKGDLPFYIRPWANRATGESIEIAWISQGEVEPGTVTLTADGKTFSATATKEPMKDTVCHRQSATVTGLQPGVEYVWSVSCGSEQVEGSVRTAPPAGEEIVFSVTGDTQSQPDLHRMVAEAMAKDKPDVVLHVGDLTDRGAVWGRWRTELFDPGWPYFQQAVFYPTKGNHDGGPYYPRLFGYDYRELYDSFRYGDVLFIIVDSYGSGASGKGAQKQMEWIRQVATASDATWKVVNLHVPMIATDPRLKWFGEKDFAPLFEELGIDIVVCGHHPQYRRYLGHGDEGEKPVIHVTAGGGGQVGGWSPSPALVAGKAVQHHATFRVQGNRLEMTAKQPDGTVLDHMVLIKDEAGNYQQEIMDQRLPLGTIKQVRHLYEEMLRPRSFHMQADTETLPVAGKPMELTLKVSRFARGGWNREALPEGLKLIIKAGPDTAWDVPEQTIDATQEVMTFTAIPPEGAALGPGGFTPELQVTINMALGERTLIPFTTTVIIHSDTLRKLLDDQQGSLPVDWQFRLDPSNEGLDDGWFRPDAGGTWDQLAVTDVWENQGHAYDGVAWYRMQVTLPPLREGHRYWLEFGAIDESCRLFVNGQLIAHQPYNSELDDDAWRKPRRFDISSALQPGPTHIAVQVEDRHGLGGIYRGASLFQQPANRLQEDPFGAGLDAWRVVAGEANLATANGAYVAEQSLRVETTGTLPCVLKRTVSARLDSGDYQLRYRYSARPNSGAGSSGECLRFALHPAAGKDALVSVAATSATMGDWDSGTNPFTINETPSGNAMELIVTVSRPGIYLLDSFGVYPTER